MFRRGKEQGAATVADSTGLSDPHPVSPDKSKQLLRELDELCSKGAGSPGIIAVSDLEAVYRAKRELALEEHRTRTGQASGVEYEDISRLTSARVGISLAERQVNYHTAAIKGYASAHQKASELASGLEEVESQIGSGGPYVYGSVAIYLSGAIYFALGRTSTG